jgi:hypothetical protein
VTNSEGVRVDAAELSVLSLKLYKREFRRSAQLARLALSHTHNPHIQAESYFLLARAAHAEGPSGYIDALQMVCGGVQRLLKHSSGSCTYCLARKQPYPPLNDPHYPCMCICTCCSSPHQLAVAVGCQQPHSIHCAPRPFERAPLSLPSHEDMSHVCRLPPPPPPLLLTPPPHTIPPPFRAVHQGA